MLSNILFDDLDNELERRGHKFCRYADECNIMSKRVGERVLALLTNFLSETLKQTVNSKKFAADHSWKRKFLGYSMTSENNPRLKVAKESVKRFTGNLKKLVRCARGRNNVMTGAEVNSKLAGWINNFILVEVKNIFEEFDGTTISQHPVAAVKTRQEAVQRTAKM